MPTLSTVLLTIKGEARKANLQLNSNGELEEETLQKYFKKKDTPEIVGRYEYDDKVIFLVGYTKGKKGTENKTQLPAPYNTTIMYGDILLILALDEIEKPYPFTTDNWAKFCNSMEDKEEDGDDEDDEDDEEEDDEILSAEEEASIKSGDGFDDEEIDAASDLDVEEEEEPLPEPIAVTRKKRAPVYGASKIDANILKEETTRDSSAESNKIRSLCLTQLNFLSNNFSNEDIRKLEQAIFEATFDNAIRHYIPRSWKSTQFCELYRQIVRTVFNNIHPESPVNNPRLIKRVLEGEFTLDKIPSMSSYEMYPEKWMELEDRQLLREQKILEGNRSRATDQFKCRRCGKRECTYYEMQTRSADEPMTIFVTCLNCGKRWRGGG